MSNPTHGTPATPIPNGAPLLNSRLMAIRLDTYICVAIGFAILLRLPRAWGRIWKAYEWRSGHILQLTDSPGKCPVRERRLTSLPDPSVSSIVMEKGYPESDMSHTVFNHEGRRSNNGDQSMEPSHPPHIASCPSILWPFSDLLGRRVFISYSNIQVIIVLAYLSLLLYALLYLNNVFTHPVRAGWIAVSQLPFLFSFATRNNVLAHLLGLDFQHFNYLHRFLGRFVIGVANLHAIGFIYRWSLEDGIFAHLDTSNIWGSVSLLCFNAIFFSSSSFMRTKAYNSFFFTHVVCYLTAVPAIYNHQPSTLPFIIALSVPYCLDHALRLLKTRLVTATVTPLPSMDATRIEIPTLNTGWLAGQYVRVRILSTSLGWFKWAESHPFSISSAPIVFEKHAVGNRGLVMICKNAGTWTRRLSDVAKKGDIDFVMENGANVGRTLKVLVEGPYGGPGNAIFSSYSAVTLVIGGSGITFALSVIQDLVQKHLQSESRVRAITLVWMVQKPDALTPLLPLFIALATSFPGLSISVRYTRAYSMRINRSESTSQKKKKGIPRPSPPASNSHDLLFPVIPQNLPITLHPGRPSQVELASVVDNAIRRALDVENDPLSADQTVGGLLVGICGPAGMGKQVRDVVSSIPLARKYQVGGIEIHEEAFEW